MRIYHTLIIIFRFAWKEKEVEKEKCKLNDADLTAPNIESLLSSTLL